jgi:hypothetical protein
VGNGELYVIGRNYFARQAATLLNFAKLTKDPAVAAALLDKAGELNTHVDGSDLPDPTPLAPDIEPPTAP